MLICQNHLINFLLLANDFYVHKLLYLEDWKSFRNESEDLKQQDSYDTDSKVEGVINVIEVSASLYPSRVRLVISYIPLAKYD